MDPNKDKVNKNKFNGDGAGSQWVDVLLNDAKSPKEEQSGDGQGTNQKARLCVSQAHGLRIRSLGPGLGGGGGRGEEWEEEVRTRMTAESRVCCAALHECPVLPNSQSINQPTRNLPSKSTINPLLARGCLELSAGTAVPIR